jgi:hypothetical protein
MLPTNKGSTLVTVNSSLAGDCGDGMELVRSFDALGKLPIPKEIAPTIPTTKMLTIGLAMRETSP